MADLLSKRSDSAAVRAAIASEDGYDPALWSTLVDQIGAAALSIPEAHEGAGATWVETHLVCEELGRTLAPSPLLGSAVLAAQAVLATGDRSARERLLPRVAAGEQVALCWAAEEGWQDPLSRKALQFIERRQRNRGAIERSPFASLEEAVAAAQTGLTRETAEEIAYLSGLKPMTGAKIFTDPGGEPVAILCKATGLPRAAVRG